MFRQSTMVQYQSASIYPDAHACRIRVASTPRGIDAIKGGGKAGSDTRIGPPFRRQTVFPLQAIETVAVRVGTKKAQMFPEGASEMSTPARIDAGQWRVQSEMTSHGSSRWI